MQATDFLKPSNILNTRDVQDYILKEITSKQGFQLATLPMILNSVTGIRSDLMELYMKYTATVEGVTKGLLYQQAALYEGILFGYNTETKKISLYTASDDVIRLIDPEYELKQDTAYALNKDGSYYAVRLDLTYTAVNDFKVKITKLNVKTRPSYKDTIFVPLTTIYIFNNFIKLVLSKGKTLKVLQDRAGVMKERFVSSNAEVLQRYSDNAQFARLVSSGYMSQLLSGVVYVPVVGAPSTTLGLTRVDAFTVEGISVVSDTGDLVEVSDYSPQILLIVNSLISNLYASKYHESTIDSYNSMVEVLVDIVGQKVFLDKLNSIETPKDMPESAIISFEALSALLTDLNDQQISTLWDNLKDFGIRVKSASELAKYLDSDYEILKSSEYRENPEAFKDLIQTSVVKVVTTNQSGKFSTMYITNNEDILSKIYGDDYFAKFESVGVKLRKAKYLLDNGSSLDEVAAYCGFDSLAGSDTGSVEGNKELVSDYVTNVLGYKPRKFTPNDFMVLGKRVFGTVTPTGVKDYYCNVDLSKVHQVVRTYKI